MKLPVPRGTPAALLVCTMAIAAVLITADGLHARAARRGHGDRERSSPSSPGSVVVLGFANKSPRINMINRWRARIAVRTARGRPAARIICSGGAVHGPIPEGELLAQYIREHLGWSGAMTTETASRSTWENVRNVAPLLADAAWIVFASNSIHAEKARAYLRRQHPALADHLIPGRDHRWGEMLPVKPIFAAVGLWKLARPRRST